MEALIQVRHITKFRVQSAEVTFYSKHLRPFLGSNTGVNLYPAIWTSSSQTTNMAEQLLPVEACQMDRKVD